MQHVARKVIQSDECLVTPAILNACCRKISEVSGIPRGSKGARRAAEDHVGIHAVDDLVSLASLVCRFPQVL